MREAAAFFAAHSIEQIAMAGGTVEVAASPTVAAYASDVKADVENAVAAEKKPRKSKKDAVPAPASEVAAEAKPAAPELEKESGAEQAPPPGASITLDDVRKALEAYVGRSDFSTGTALVRTFAKADGTPAVRMSDLQEKDWPAFIAKCKPVQS
jgi:hypothetical protein